MSAGPIRSAAVAGDGVAAWTAAATLARRLRGVSVQVVPVRARPGVVDRITTMGPEARAFHRGLGLSDADVLMGARGVLRLGDRLDGWAADQPPYVAGHGGYVPADAPPGFAALQAALDPAPFSAHSAAAALAEAGRAALDPAGPLSLADAGLAAEPSAYRAFLRAYARHLGTREHPAPLRAVRTAGDRIERLELADGTAVEADLYVDASGPDALLLAALPGGGKRRSWRDWLPATHVSVGEAPADQALPPVDTTAAGPDGWRLACPLRDRTLVARVAAGSGGGEALRLDQGRRARAWIGNCVALGDAAVEVEPLRAAPLRLLHAACDRIVALLPDIGFAEVELAHHNREWADEADAVRDFLMLHYATATRPEPFWRRARAAPPTAGLADTLALFAERGRLAPRDHGVVGPDQWLAVLMGNGARPRRLDALAAAVDPDAFRAWAAGRRAAIARAAAAAPTHAELLARLPGARAA